MMNLRDLKGVGEQKAKALVSSGITNVSELIQYLPRRYLDKTRFQNINEIRIDEPAHLIGIVTDCKLSGVRQNSRLSVQVKDETGSIELMYFNGASFWQHRFPLQQRLQIWGVPKFFGKLQIAHPELKFLKEDEEPIGSIEPVYPLTEILSQKKIEHKFLNRIILEGLDKYSLTDPLSEEYLSEFNLHPFSELLKKIHSPKDVQMILPYFDEIKIRELVPLCINVEEGYRQRIKRGRPLLLKDNLANQLENSLPFSLTSDQQKALKEINQLLKSKAQSYMLLQGDVGSGKTVVAVLSLLNVIQNDIKVVYLAPTEILAQQQFKILQSWLNPLNIKVNLLTGSTSRRERNEILFSLNKKAAEVVIGTHALLTEDVKYNNLGYVIIDEQHRFGVQQRELLVSKGEFPDVLYMTATPIPRTLSQTIYGDFQSILIKEKPENRKSIQTRLVPHQKREEMYVFLNGEIKKGAQIYWVAPRVKDTSASKSQEVIQNQTEEDLWGFTDILEKNRVPLQSVEALEKELKGKINTSFSVLHGKMDSNLKEQTLNDFKSGAINVLLATTVVEVGIDVPNATIMVLENPDRFGLAQLHQLRGRVGRGEKESWCFLSLPEQNYSSEIVNRLEKFSNCEDGFELAELDLQNRGTGNLDGVDQSGFGALKYSDLIRDYELVVDVRNRVGKVLEANAASN